MKYEATTLPMNSSFSQQLYSYELTLLEQLSTIPKNTKAVIQKIPVWHSEHSHCLPMSEPSDSEDKITEEREELMVSPTGDGDPTLRIAHFLTPSVIHVAGETILDLPPGAFSPPAASDLSFIRDKKKSNLNVHFSGWRQPQKEWKTWVENMRSLHSSAWKKAGIYDAIMNSTYKIHRNDDLIYGFAEKWCPETNSFVFPWAEATITLEDMMMLGGFSVLGDPVFSPVESLESEGIQKKLTLARQELTKSKSRKAGHSLWLHRFINTGSEVEHEAFLALWLSRFVFPPRYRSPIMLENVFPVAVNLARGCKIALAPAVLANLYANLSKMKMALFSSDKLKVMNKKDSILEVFVSAPFQLVQVWIWERFLTLRPKPLTFEHHLPRFARWNDLRVQDSGDVRLAIDEAAAFFRWRPYSMRCQEKADKMLVCSGMDEEKDVLVRLVRVSELAGIDSKCIEQYLPHRVAMQFGFDQDIPGCVSRANSSQIMAWKNYTRKAGDENLYAPSRLFESDVTARYVEWWKKFLSARTADPINTHVSGVSCKGLKKKMLLNSSFKKSVSNALASAKLSRKSIMVRANGSKCKKAATNRGIPKSLGRRVLLNSAGKKSLDGALAVPGFPAKPNAVGTSHLDIKHGQIRANRLRDGTLGNGKSQNRVRLTGSGYKKALANLNSENDTSVSPGFPPKPLTVSARDSVVVDEQSQIKRLMNEYTEKDSAQNMVRLTGSEYKKAIANQMSPKSLEKRGLLSSAGNKLGDDALVPPGFQPKHKIVGSRDSFKEDEQMKAKLWRKDAESKDVNERQNQTKRLRTGSHEKDCAQKVVQLSGLEYKKALADKMTPKSLGRLSLAGNKSDSDALVPPGFHAMHSTVGPKDSGKEGGQTKAKDPRIDPESREGSKGQDKTKQLRDGSDEEDSAQNMVRLTGPEYKKTLANRMSSCGMGKRVLLNSAGSKLDNDDLVLPSFQPVHIAVGTRELGKDGQTQAKRLRNDPEGKDGGQKDSLVPPGFLPKHDRVRTCDSGDKDGQFQAKCRRIERDDKDKAQKDSQLESPFSLIFERATAQNMQEDPSEIYSKSEIEKETALERKVEPESRPGEHVKNGFSLGGSNVEYEGAETRPFCDQPLRPSSPVFIKASNGAEDASHKAFNSNTGDGKGCSSSSFQDRAMKLEARIRNLERIVALVQKKA